MPIPEFNERGYLPPGQHIATWREFLERFGTNPQRLRLATGLAAALRKLAIVGCGRVIIGGSFVTVKEVPNDFDAYFDDFGLDFEAIDPIFIDRDRIDSRKFLAANCNLPLATIVFCKPTARAILKGLSS